MREPPDDDDDPWLIDFFEEGETSENPSASAPAPASARAMSSPRRLGRGPSPAGIARARLLGLGVVVVLGLTIALTLSLSGGGEAGADTAYLARIAVPAQNSQGVGSALGQLLSTAPSSLAALETQLNQLYSRQQQDLSETVAISPPPRLRSEQQWAVSAMQFRLGGLSGLLTGFHSAQTHPTAADWPDQLSIQAERLITSDIIWQDLFLAPTETQLASDGVHDSTVPPSTFVANANLTAPSAMRKVLGDLVAHVVAPSTSPNSVLQLGSVGPAVTAWQKKLNLWIAHQAAITKLPVNGHYDQATQTATMDLQTAEQIPVDGVVGPETRSALTTALSQYASKG